VIIIVVAPELNATRFIATNHSHLKRKAAFLLHHPELAVHRTNAPKSRAQSKKVLEMIFAFSMAKSTSRDNPFLQGNPVNGVPASMDSTVWMAPAVATPIV